MKRLLPLLVSLALGCPGPTTAPAPSGALALPAPLFDDSQRPPPTMTPTPGPSAVTQADHLSIVFSAATRGAIEPCACPGRPSGGIGRRVSFLRRLGELLGESLVVVEGPGLLFEQHLRASGELGEEPRRRAQVMLSGSVRAGAVAFGPGAEDLALATPAELGRLADAAGLPLVSANVVDEDGVLLFEPSMLIERGDRRLLLTSVARAAPTAAVRSAADAMAAVLAAAPPHDLLVVLTDLRGAELTALEAQVPGLVLTDEELAPTRLHTRSLVASVEPLGRELGRIEVFFTGRTSCLAVDDRAEVEARGWARLADEWVRHAWDADGLPREPSPSELGPAVEGMQARRLRFLDRDRRCHLVAQSNTPLMPEIGPDPAVSDLLDAYQLDFVDELVARWEADRLRGRREVEADIPYRGADHCISCHSQEYVNWTHGAHAVAWASLVESDATDNHECLPCHTTGHDRAYDRIDSVMGRRMRNVQCEACHGPGGDHPNGTHGLIAPDEAVCLGCHDEANSPEFDYATWLPRGSHRGGAVPAAASP